MIRLQDASSPEDGLVQRAVAFTEAMNPLIDSVAVGPFRNYTLHNRDHAKKVLFLAGTLVGENTLSLLSAAECLIILYSAYLHDLGLVLPDADRLAVIESNEFLESVQNWPAISEALGKTRKLLDSARGEAERTQLELYLADLHNTALSNYLRPLHATPERYQTLVDLIRRNSPGVDFFSIDGVSFEAELVDVCVSHNLDAAVLAEMLDAQRDRFPRELPVGRDTVNTQFCAAVLRIADILDFDFERTPRVLFESLGIGSRKGPGSAISLAEWMKHQSVQKLGFFEREVVVRAECDHPAIEAAVREFCDVIEGEIRRTQSILVRNPGPIAEKYELKVPSNVRAEVRSKGYVFMDLSLRLDEAAVMSLLMGTSLYPSRHAAVREIIQNAVDACLVRTRMEADPNYRPEVKLTQKMDHQGRTWLLLADNGIGMDRSVLADYFFRVGSSYYRSNAFARLLRTIGANEVPLISKFGIGFLSVFMLADMFEVETRATSAVSTDNTGRRVRVERVGALAYVEEDPRVRFGTLIKLRLRPEYNSSEEIARVNDYLQTDVVRPAVPVVVDVSGESFRVQPQSFISPKRLEPEGAVEMVTLQLEESSREFRGRVFLFFHRDSENRLSALGPHQIEVTSGPVRRGRVKVEPLDWIDGFEGNRISVGGFRMRLGRLGRLLRFSSRRYLAAVLDIDITPSDLVVFDVSRTRILDESMELRLRLKDALWEALQRCSAWPRIHEKTRKLLAVRSKNDPFRLEAEGLKMRADLVDDEALLSDVLELLPRDRWPPHVHRTVAQQLGVSNRLAFNAVSTLIVNRRVANPNYLEDRKPEGER